jgi:YhcH/YjgK/YiaL family protein
MRLPWIYSRFPQYFVCLTIHFKIRKDMIVDTLDHAGLYAKISDRFAIALKYLQITNLAQLEVGKHEIEGKEVFAAVSEYNSKNIEDAKWEAHKKYADIQVIVSGEEKMGYATLSNMVVKEGYNAEKDIVILSGTGDYVTGKPGNFIIFFPQDAHQPCVAINGSTPIKKVVIKVLM